MILNSLDGTEGFGKVQFFANDLLKIIFHSGNFGQGKVNSGILFPELRSLIPQVSRVLNRALGVLNNPSLDNYNFSAEKIAKRVI